jgi:translocation and assembly module TamA
MRQDDGALVTTSQTLRAGRPQSGPRFDRNVYLQYEQANVTGAASVVAPAALVGDGAALSLNAAWTGRFFDSPTLPTRGHGLSGEIGVGVTTMGVRKPFTRLTGRWLDIVPVGAGGSRLALRAEGGAVIGARQARLPATQLFRTGGDATVRGYAYRSIGIPLGGNWSAPAASWRWAAWNGSAPSPSSAGPACWSTCCSSTWAAWPTTPATCAPTGAWAPACA